MAVAEKTKPTDATTHVEGHKTGRWRDMWKRAALLGFGLGLLVATIGILASAPAVVGAGIIGGLLAGSGSMVLQSFTRGK